MKKFIGRILFIIVIVVGVYAFINFLPAQFTQEYNAAALDKTKLLMSTRSPKIILVAGSNFAFGIDSKAIEEATNMPVVNIGLHAGLQPYFMIEMAKKNIQEGDIVILGLEFSCYYGENADVQTIFTTVENYPLLWSCVDKNDYLHLAKGYMRKYGIKKIMRYAAGSNTPTGVYSRAAFNRWGDIDFPRDNNVREPYEAELAVSKDLISMQRIRLINEFNDYILKQGATLYITYPSCDKKSIKSEYPEIQDFAYTLNDLLDSPIISDINDYILPSELFYDTNYHLNDNGVEVRTKLLIDDIMQALN